MSFFDNLKDKLKSVVQSFNLDNVLSKIPDSEFIDDYFFDPIKGWIEKSERVHAKNMGMAKYNDEILPNLEEDKYVPLKVDKFRNLNTNMRNKGYVCEKKLTATGINYTGINFDNLFFNKCALIVVCTANVKVEIKMQYSLEGNYYVTLYSKTFTSGAYGVDIQLYASDRFNLEITPTSAAAVYIRANFFFSSYFNVVEDITPQLGGDLSLNGKNIDFPSVANVSDCKDEDNMASNSATMLSTQQSIKAYADTKCTDAEVDAIVLTHKNIAAAHHAKYTDAEVEAIITAELVNGQSIDNGIDSLILTHKNIAAAHHAKYTDAESVSAMGAKSDDNPLNHDKAGGACNIATGIYTGNSASNRQITGLGFNPKVIMIHQTGWSGIPNDWSTGWTTDQFATWVSLKGLTWGADSDITNQVKLITDGFEVNNNQTYDIFNINNAIYRWTAGG